MGDAELGRDLAGVMDVLTRAAGAGAVGCGAVIVKLQRHADDVVARLLHEARHDRGVDAPGHGDDDACRCAGRGEAQIDVHGSGPTPNPIMQTRVDLLPNLKETQGCDLADF